MTSKADTWRRHLDAWRSSGQTIAAFCRRHGLSYARFMYWQRRLGAARTELVPVHVQAPDRPATRSVELTCAGGMVLRIDGVSVPEIAALIRALSC